jgi:uncharacterized membrane protein YdjX (TVP38/TMEM64 family)
MKIKTYKHIIVFILASIVTVLLYIWFSNSIYFEGFKHWSQSNLILYISILLLIKIVGIIWPPIPGGIFTIASIPIIGWQFAYMADLFGSIIGSSFAFFIARKWGFQVLKKIFDDSTLEKIRNIKVKKHKEIETIFLMRLFGGSIIEVICYGAGVLGISYRNYLVATIASHIPVGVPLFYLANNFLGDVLSRNGLLISGFFLCLAIFIFYKFKHRYFEFN